MPILAIRNYTSQKGTFDELDFEDLACFTKILDEVLTGESDLTQDGVSFMLKRIEEDSLVEKIIKNGGLQELRSQNKEEIESTLRAIVPLQTANFIWGDRSTPNQ